MQFLCPARCQNRVTFPALCARSVPGLFVIGFWHIENNRILFMATGTGKTNNIPGSRPNNRRFYGTFYHCLTFPLMIELEIVTSSNRTVIFRYLRYARNAFHDETER